MVFQLKKIVDFRGGPAVKNPTNNAGNMDSTLVGEYFTCSGATKRAHNY